MSENELNSYRFLSGQEPTDEMLECIMKDALDCAMSRKREAEERLVVELKRMREMQRQTFNSRLNSILNG